MSVLLSNDKVTNSNVVTLQKLFDGLVLWSFKKSTARSSFYDRWVCNICGSPQLCSWWGPQLIQHHFVGYSRHIAKLFNINCGDHDDGTNVNLSWAGESDKWGPVFCRHFAPIRPSFWKCYPWNLTKVRSSHTHTQKSLRHLRSRSRRLRLCVAFALTVDDSSRLWVKKTWEKLTIGIEPKNSSSTHTMPRFFFETTTTTVTIETCPKRVRNCVHQDRCSKITLQYEQLGS
jgi:hypothetical protein